MHDTHNLWSWPNLKDCILHTLQESVTKVEICEETKKSKMHFLWFWKIQHNRSTNEYHQVSHYDFAKLPPKGFCKPSKLICNISQPISPSKSSFRPFETKVTHLSSCTLTIFSFYDTSKWSQFSSDHATCKSQLCHYATLEFYKLGNYPGKITCIITNHSNIVQKKPI